MADEDINAEVLKAKIGLLDMLINRECKYEAMKMPEHFNYMRKLKYDYELELEHYEGEAD